MSSIPQAAQNVSKISVLGSHFSALPRAAAHNVLLEAAREGKGGYVCVSNVHTTMTGFFLPEFRQVTNEAALAVPDGVPLVWAIRSMGFREQDRVRGPTLMRDIFDLGRAQGARHYLYGGSPKSLAALKETLLRNYPGAEIVGAESPPFKPLHDISEREWNETAERINAAKPHFVWIGLGAPKQERWMNRQKNSVKGIMLGVGAAFDLIPGLIPEAPMLMQKCGLEWLYRFTREPRRLWTRYFFYNPAFLVLWFGQICLHAVGAEFLVKRSR